jgi:hypothetical protein
MKTSKIVIGLATMLCVAVLAAHPASAGFFDPPNNPYPPSGPYRAINHSPITGRTYSKEADYPTLKHRVPKTKAKR